MRLSKRDKILFLVAAGFAGASVLLLALANYITGFAQWYTVHLYDKAVNTMGRFFGMLPFSASEVLLYAALISLAVCIAAVIRRKFSVIRAAAGLILTASLLFFLYTTNCGINYHRTSFAESSGIAAGDYSVNELAEVCLMLTEEVNQTSALVHRNEQHVMHYDADVENRAAEVMRELSQSWPELEGYYPRAKGLLNPWILSVQKNTGIYSPFTIEANVNTGMTDYNIPFTACHELSHLRGFMQEEEANFIAWLACREADDPDFRYSGSLRGWISCMNVLYRADQERWAEIRVLLSPAVEPDLAANRAYWAKYEGKIAEIAETVNDNYLKANGQSDGVQSYGRMADLIVAYYINETEHTD